MKNAYLIIAHGNYEQLIKLLSYLDDENNDFFIHINSLVEMPDISECKNSVKQSKVFFTDRVKVVWGEYGILEAMLVALSTARNYAKYDYYHVLTGADLPIKSKKYIDNFLQDNLYNNQSNGLLKTNYIYIDDSIDEETLSRVTKYNFFVKYFRYKNRYIQKIARGINKVGYLVQHILGINRFGKYEGKIYKGAPWWSITDECAEFIVENINWIEDNFSKMTFGADELAIQTIVMNSKFFQSLYRSQDKKRNNMNVRLIDWTRGRPYTWKNENYDELIRSDHLFARKFDLCIDNKIIERIYTFLEENNHEI